MWSEGCICCSPDTVQQSSARAVLAGTPSRTEDIAYVHCQNCSCKVCSFCVMGLTQLVTTSNKRIPPEDPSISALKSMALALKSMDEPKVDFGFCCSFKQSIPTSTKTTIVTPPRAPELSIADSHDTDFVLMSDKSAKKKCRRYLNNRKDNDPATVNFLSAYFQDDTPPASMNPANTSQIVGLLNKSRKKSRRPKYTMNNFQGALVFPPFGLLVKADATNHHLSCDHMALAESSEDGTKAVIHGVISDKTGKIVQEYFDAQKKVIKPIASERKRILLNVTSPEDIKKNMNVVVDVFVVKQVNKCSEFQDWKGNTNYDPEFISNLQTFGQNNIAYVSVSFSH